MDMHLEDLETLQEHFCYTKTSFAKFDDSRSEPKAIGPKTIKPFCNSATSTNLLASGSLS